MPDADEEGLCYTAAGAAAAAGGALSLIPAAMYARHRYKLAHSKCSLWKEQVKAIEVFQQKMEGNNRGTPISSNDLKELFLDPNIPNSLKKEISISSNLRQHFEVATNSTADEVKDVLYPLMYSEDRDALDFVLNPSHFKEDQILTGLTQYSSYFANHSKIFDYLLAQLPSNFCKRDEVKAILTKIKKDQAVSDQKTPKRCKISIHVGSKTIEVSQNKLSQRPVFFRNIRKRNANAAASDANDSSNSDSDTSSVSLTLASHKTSDESDSYEISLQPGQDPEIVLLLLQWIDKGAINCSAKDVTSLIKEADQFGLNDLVHAAISKELHNIQKKGQQQRAEMYLNLIMVAPDGVISELKHAIENEYCTAADQNEIEDVRFWLKFARKHAPDHIFHECSKWPQKLSPDFVDIIYELQPKKLYKALNLKLAKKCLRHPNPIKIIEKYSNNKPVFHFLIDSLLDWYAESYIVQIWDMACIRNSNSLKKKVVERLQMHPSLATQWPFLELPKELSESLNKK